MKNLIFLGAGASKSDGAPLQGELFSEYFNMRKIKKESSVIDGLDESCNSMDFRVEKKIRSFFSDFFGIKDNDDVYPTFEEALGMLDLAISRKEYFYNNNRCFNFDSLEMGYYESYRLALVFSMAEVIDYKLSMSTDKFHNQLIKNNKKRGDLNSTTFVSTNYDILIDNAILKNYCEIDYGFNDDTNGDRIKLLKLHGSLNWLYCPVCKQIEVTGFEKGAVWLLNSLRKAQCKKCASLSEAVIVPPTFFKDYTNSYLSSVWDQVDKQFSVADNIVFCGYSFPDADIYIKYLLKRGEVLSKKNLNIYIVNNFEGKPQDLCKEELNKYLRFFKYKDNVKYTSMSFQDFVSDPFQLIE